MQYQLQTQQAPKKERLPPELTMPIAVANKELKQISEQNLRMSKSMEFLDKAGRKQASPAKASNQQKAKKGGGAWKKPDDCKESDMVS